MVAGAWRRWLEKVFPAARRGRKQQRLLRQKPGIEVLEDRMLPSAVTVTNPNDDGSNTALRAAVQQADETGGAITIKLVSGRTYHLNNGANFLGDLPVQTLGQTAVNLTITTTGSGMATIDANFTSRLFEVLGDQGYGGATLNLTNIHLNRGEEDGAVGGGVLVDSGGTLNLQKSSITNCIDQGSFDYGGGQGGAIFNSGTTSLQNSKIQNNQALGFMASESYGGSAYGGNAFGGGVYNDGSLTLLNGTFSGNNAEGGSASGSSSGTTQGGSGFGGGLYDQGVSLSITGTTFSKNLAIGGDASLSGGEGIAIGGAAYGGGAFLSGGEGQLSISTAVFQNNEADGGAGNNSGGARGNGGMAEGGALFNLADVLLQKTKIQNNFATGGSSQSGGAAYGGGILNGGALQIQDSTISGNTAMGGTSTYSYSTEGGDSFGGGIASPTTLFKSRNGDFLEITGSTISKNEAVGGDAVITGGEGTANGGFADGGGLFWSAGGEGLLINDTFAFNTALGGMGTVARGLTGSSGFGGGAEGGAMFVSESGYGGIGLGFVTVAYNHATGGNGTSGTGGSEGGGIVSFGGEGAPTAMENDIVAKNVAASSNDVVGNFDSFGHNLIGDDTGSNGFDSSEGDILGTQGATVNPGLDTQLRNNGGPTQTLALLPGSIAIDHGDNSFDGPDSNVDQRGVSRPQPAGGIVDIGAYEFIKTHVSLSEYYRVHWNATATDNNFITGNLLAPLIKAGILPPGTTATVSVPNPPAGFTVQPDGTFVYKPPVGFFSVAPPLNFHFSVLVGDQDLGEIFNVFITVYRGLRLSKQT